ncbi:hypothetical protein ABNR98_004468 [Salmonella enterica]
MLKKFKYEIVKVDGTPTFEKEAIHEYVNPVSVGDKIKPDYIGSDIVYVVEIIHFPTVSVIFYDDKPKNMAANGLSYQGKDNEQ